MTTYGVKDALLQEESVVSISSDAVRTGIVDPQPET
jgi:hypothetical protein